MADRDFMLMCEYGLPGEVEGDHFRYREGSAHGLNTSYRTDDAERSKALGLCNAFRFWFNDDDVERVRRTLAEGYGAHVDVIYWQQFQAQKGRARAYFDAIIDQYVKLVQAHGERLWLNVLPEYDNDQWWRYADSAGPLRDRADAFRRLTQLYADNHPWALYPAPDGRPDEPPRSFFRYLGERGLKPEDLNVVTLYCQTFSPHLLYKLGARAVWPEGNVGNNHQVTIAFARGASRQYGRHWCYDVAPFDCFGGDGLPLSYDSRMRRIAGFSESFMLRAWLVSYLSGPRWFLFQASSMGFFVRGQDDALRLTPLGSVAGDFADFCLRRHPNRGRARTPIALLLAQDHGYTPPKLDQPRLYWGRLPDDRANRSIEAFFRIAFPGFHRTRGTGGADFAAWAPGGSYARQQPWMRPDITSMKEVTRAFREAIRDQTYDPRPYERPLLTASTWGDSFDVLVENASAEALGRYPAVILLGSIRLDAGLRERLSGYVRGGGRVLLNAAQVTDEDGDFLGVRFAGGTGVTPFHSCSRMTGRFFSEGRYEHAKVAPAEGVETLIECGFLGAAGTPLLLRRRLGKGEVWFFTARDYLPAPERLELSWMEAAKEAADEFIRPHLAVEVEGPSIEWLVNDTPEGALWLTLVNNAESPWTGRVRVKEPMPGATARDIWREKAVPFERDEDERVVLKPEIAPWEFVVVEIGREQR